LPLLYDLFQKDNTDYFTGTHCRHACDS